MKHFDSCRCEQCRPHHPAAAANNCGFLMQQILATGKQQYRCESFQLTLGPLPRNLLAPLQVAYKVNAADCPQVQALFQEFARLRRCKDLCDRLRLKAVILNLLAEYIRLADKNTPVVWGERDEDMRSVLAYIQVNFRRSLTTEELAEVCHMHPTHFIRAFKLRMAQTPHQYIADVRMEYARQLLDRSDRSVIQIAEDSGFYDLAHFSRTFKQYYSMTPTQYRKALPDNR